MTKRKAVLTSMLIMIPLGGIVISMIQTSIWTSLWFVGALAVYGFIALWKDIITWLIVPDDGRKVFNFKRRSKHSVDIY